MSSKPICLLTGATGFLGQAISRRLRDEMHLVRHGHRSCPDGGIQADLTDPGEVDRVLKEIQPDIVIHTAAAREPDVCEKEIAFAEKINRDLPGQLASLLPPESSLLHISTDYVFDGQNAPYTETDPVSSINVYGRTKAEAEPLVLAHPKGAVLRIPVLVGEGPGFIQLMVDALRSQEPQEIDDVLIRHPVWINDVAEACAWLLHRKATGLWHASTEQGGSRYELTLRVAKTLGLSSHHLIPTKEVVPRVAARPFNSRLSPAKLLQAGGPACKEIEQVIAEMNLI